MKALNDPAEDLVVVLTPMVDIVLVLLVFFLVATIIYTGERDLLINLPEAQAGTPSVMPPDEIVINVREDGTVVLNGESVTMKRLEGLLDAAAQRNPATPIAIRGDAKTPYGNVVRILNMCYVLNLTNSRVIVYDVPAAAGG